MSTVVRSKKNKETKARWKSAGVVGLSALALILALGSYNAEDPSLNTFSADWSHPKNILGYFGSWLSDIYLQLFGYGAWLWPALMAVCLTRWLSSPYKEEPVIKGRDWGGLCLAIAATTLLIKLMGVESHTGSFPAAGLSGIAIASASVPFFGHVGSYFVVLALSWFFCMVWWEELPMILFNALKKGGILVLAGLSASLKKWGVLENWKTKFQALSAHLESLKNKKTALKAQAASNETLAETDDAEEEIDDEDDSEEETLDLEPSTSAVPRIRTQQEAPKNKVKPEKAKPKASGTPTSWTLPPLSLLQSAKIKVKPPSEESLLATAKKITSALHSFDIEGEVVEITSGPIITLYEFQPAPGVRASKIVSASTDLAMTLGVPSVRIVAPIPGKSVAGIEVPNSAKEEVVLKDVFEETRDRAQLMKLPLVMGKDNTGAPIIEDLARMPHLLIGGATNMGKSVLVNSIMTSLLCRFSPDDLKLIVVDPKLVEFKIFEDIPHLLLPIVNDPNDASQALKWAVAETKRRYVALQKVSAKNLEGYNKKIAEDKNLEAERFPYLVIVIDELAELMLTAKKDVEQSIVRLSQLARAAGIHLIMATQRPSADVVTGLIKSNCPSRAALRVASASDSRIILDCSGAEQLLGRGDMFFTNTGPMGLKRMQGCYVSDDDIEKVCDFWREQGEPSYKEEILAPDPIEEEGIERDMGALDTLYGDVFEFAKEHGKISTSLIQRRFQIGYTRAARIMDQLEENGVVGEASVAGKPRDVIM